MSAAEEAPRPLAEDLAGVAAELVACGSLEMAADGPDLVPRIAALLPAGTPVYVNHLPRRRLADSLPVLLALAAAGLEPVPHLAARRLASRREAQAFLNDAVKRAGVRKLMLIGGDLPQPQGPYGDAAALLADCVADCGVRQIGIAAYPEGHPRIPTPRLAAALEEKLARAAAAGIAPYLVTQFSFAPARILAFVADIARRHPALPIYVGLAGPATPATLIRFAQRCGVSASLRALQAQGMRAVRLFTHADPSEQLIALARHRLGGSAGNVVGVHLYSFGGVVRTAAWMHARITRAAPGPDGNAAKAR
jgi:methylenetetrahydrofolate reductase (NADPH)